MKINENTAVRSSKVLLVPYDRRHVVKYHQWMEDPAIQEATASDRLTLEEEYENQESWRASHDKLTFILCQPLDSSKVVHVVKADVDDAPDRMVGDINFFLYPWDDEEEGESEQGGGASAQEPSYYVGEVDIMIADHSHRGQGLGTAAVTTFLHYIYRNLKGILREYAASQDGAKKDEVHALKLFMVKIKAKNESSIALFKRLGFEQQGEVNYFGEVKMVLEDYHPLLTRLPEGYGELTYKRAAN